MIEALRAVLAAYDRKAQACPYCHKGTNTHGYAEYYHVQQGPDDRMLHRVGCLAGLMIPGALFEEPHPLDPVTEGLPSEATP